MTKPEYIYQLKNLVARAELQKAIASLSANLQNTVYGEQIILISSQYAELKRQMSDGTITKAEADISRAKISKALLGLLADLNESDVSFSISPVSDLPLRNTPSSKRLVAIAALFAILITSAFLVYQFVSPQGEKLPAKDSTAKNKTDTPKQANPDTVKSRGLETVKTDKLNIQIFTDKGEKPVLKKGEMMKIFFQSNQPCYVRLIYRMADNSAVLEVDNFRIDAQNINKQIPVPTPFECDEPFGNELLTAYAQSLPFDALQTKNIGGYDVIITPLNEAYNITERGLKKKLIFAKTKMEVLTKRE